MKVYQNIWICCLIFVLIGCNESDRDKKPQDTWKTITIEVTATAYNATAQQTKKGNARLAAWGDVLEDDEKAVAVSRDLIAMGLDHNKNIRIEGLEGTYVVKDKMNRRWKKRIDIFMGLDREAALEWGKRQVNICFKKKIEGEVPNATENCDLP